MNRPYIICYMLMSINGKIDCGMTVKIAGSEEYYEILGTFNTPTCLSERVTVQLEMAEQGVFVSQNAELAEKE